MGVGSDYDDGLDVRTRSVTFLKRRPFYLCMARDDGRIRLPSSTAGITTYWDDVKTKVELKPQHVLVLAFLIILIEMLLQIYGNGLFGIAG